MMSHAAFTSPSASLIIAKSLGSVETAREKQREKVSTAVRKQYDDF
jgi:hypothetical protein